MSPTDRPPRLLAVQSNPLAAVDCDCETLTAQVEQLRAALAQSEEDHAHTRALLTLPPMFQEDPSRSIASLPMFGRGRSVLLFACKECDEILTFPILPSMRSEQIRPVLVVRQLGWTWNREGIKCPRHGRRLKLAPPPPRT